jgi:hypothetical protein
MDKEVLTTSECWHVAGGRTHFEELLEEFPELLPKYREGKATGLKANGQPRKGKTQYLRSDLMQAIKAYKMNHQRTATR